MVKKQMIKGSSLKVCGGKDPGGSGRSGGSSRSSGKKGRN
jgi:hypothetical protein